MDVHKICQICFVPAKSNEKYHSHYGKVCCLSCKAFFRRTIRDEQASYLICKNEQNCDLRQMKRIKCKKCRFNQCLKIGLEPNKVCFLSKNS